MVGDPITIDTGPAPTPGIQSPDVSVLRNAWIEAVGDFDNARADQILSRAFANYPVKYVLAEVMNKGLVEIGDQWYRGKNNDTAGTFCFGRWSSGGCIR